MSHRYFRPLSELLSEFWQGSGRSLTNDGASAGLRTGFPVLDALVGGLRQSPLTVCAAATSAGKSALAFQLARNAAIGEGARVALFSIQHPGDAVACRLIAAESGVDIERLHVGMMTDSEEMRAIDAAARLAGMNVYIDDSVPITVSEIRSKLIRLRDEIGQIDLVVVDQLDLLAVEDATADGDRHDVNATALREMARDLEISIVATAGIRRPASNGAGIPTLTDICGDGSVEELADVIILIYREDAHVTQKDWETRNFDQPYPEGITKLIVAKHRNGPTGVVHLRFRNHLSRFEDLMVIEEASA